MERDQADLVRRLRDICRELGHPFDEHRVPAVYRELEDRLARARSARTARERLAKQISTGESEIKRIA